MKKSTIEILKFLRKIEKSSCATDRDENVAALTEAIELLEKMENKVNFSLSKENSGILLEELSSLYNYHWNDDSMHAKNCGSKVVGEIECQIAENFE